MNKNTVLCIVVLVAIAVVCVGILSILNDLLYVAPNMSVFSDILAGEYVQVEIKNVQTSSGKVTLLTEGKTSEGKDVIGMYVLGNKFGQSGSFELAVIVEVESGILVGIKEVTDGSSGGYSYDEEKLQYEIGKSVLSDEFAGDELVITGTTNSSTAVRYALMVVSEYYSAVYGD